MEMGWSKMSLPKLPLSEWIEYLVNFFMNTFEPLFNFLSEGIGNFVSFIVWLLTIIPAPIFILIIAGIAFIVNRFTFSLFTFFGLLLIYNLGYWEATMDTLALVLSSVLISLILGVPIGIWMSQNKRVQDIITPILDFMQTMPAFVYLIPAVLFFGIGVVPGIISSVIFAMPPTIRLTNLGIRQVPAELIEAADAYGSTRKQKLFKVQLPLAKRTIMAGINQSIMLSLSMVVIASLVGAPGLGEFVYRAVTQIKVGVGFEAGLSMVILAIILDRLSQNFGQKKGTNKAILFIFPIIFILIVGFAMFGDEKSNTEEDSTTVGQQVNYKIIGIEPGAGIMEATLKALEEYDNLTNWKLQDSSSTAMATELKKAYEKEEPIIITGWTPHWKFAKFDLKYLDDPKGVYGEAENIHTLVRQGLKEEKPDAYTILERFYWTPEDMADVMVDIQEGKDPNEAAEAWIEANREKVAQWTEGTEQVVDEEISLTYVAWDSEIASTHVVGKVLESIGYNVRLIQLDAGPMFAAVAKGDADGMVAAWLPGTHAPFMDEYGDRVENLGSNLEGAKIGLVVPYYMDIDSIEDLE